MNDQLPTITILQYPTAKRKSKKNYRIACQLQAMVWLGRAADQDDFDFNTRGKISVYAETVKTPYINSIQT